MEFIDQLHRKIEINFPPRKIISLVPSQTELLCDLGLEDQLIAVTKFCVHPAHIRKSKQIIGGTKNLRIEEIKKLNPDLIIANKEENDQKQIETLSNFFPVWISDIKNFDDALDMINKLGEITDKKNQSQKIIDQILEAKTNFQNLLRSPQFAFQNPHLPAEAQFTESGLAGSAIPTLYLIWKDPYMTIGGDTFISNMLEMAGFKNIFQHLERYPELLILNLPADASRTCCVQAGPQPGTLNSELLTLNPQLIFLSSEPYPFKEKHIQELQTIFPQSKIILVDGEMFSWYGSRMLHCFDYFLKLHTAFNEL